MPQDDTTPAGGQAAQPIMPGGSSLVKTGGGAVVNEAGTTSVAAVTANPAAQPVSIGGSDPVATPSVGASTSAASPSADPFAAPAWLQPAPAAVSTPVPSVEPVSPTPPAAAIAPSINEQPAPVPAAEPIDWDAIAKRFADQPAPASPMGTTPTDLNPTAPDTAGTQSSGQTNLKGDPEPLVTPVIPGLDNGLPELPPEAKSDPKQGEQKPGGLKSLLSSFSVDWSILPWNKKKKTKEEKQSSKPEVGVPAAVDIPTEPVVKMAGVSSPDASPELTGLDGIPKDLFDPNNLVSPMQISNPKSTIGGDRAEVPSRKGPDLVKIFILLLVVVLLGSGTLFLVTQVFSPLTPPPSDNPGTPQPTPTDNDDGQSPGVVVPDPDTGNGQTPTNQGKDIYVFLVAYGVDQPSGEVNPDSVPAGSIRLGRDYLVRVLTAEEVQTEEPVSAALAKLFSLKTEDYLETGYHNLLYKSALKALIKEGTEGELLIDLQGEFVVESVTDYLYAKQQIERTIENYTFNYTLTYNGSEDEWKHLGVSN